MKSGYLQVSSKHQLYYETSGRDDSIPVIVIHGGPGVGSNKKDFEFFDPEKYFTILYDQRGAGKSLPDGELDQNNTSQLIDDIALLLDFLMVKKVILFGGSWGSCLALLFSMRYPEKVAGIVLRGTFLGSLDNRIHFEEGGNAQQFPLIWNRFKSLVPEDHQENIFDYYLDKILDGDPDAQRIYAYELERYGLSFSSVNMTSDLVTQKLERFDGVQKSIVFAHYSKNNFFIKDNYILEHADQIPKVRIHLVHGAEDWICLPEISQALHEKIRESELSIVPGGHSQHCTGVKKRLVEIMTQW